MKRKKKTWQRKWDYETEENKEITKSCRLKKKKRELKMKFFLLFLIKVSKHKNYLNLIKLDNKREKNKQGDMRRREREEGK